jgi:hypothetical protein
MFYRCKKVQHKPINIQVRDQIQRSKRNLSVLRNGAPDCPVCQDRTDQTSQSRVFPDALRCNSPDCPVCHRTVRCTSGATAIQYSGRLQRHPDSATVENSARQSQSAELEVHRIVSRTCPVWHRTVQCRKRTKPPTVNYSRTLTVG